MPRDRASWPLVGRAEEMRAIADLMAPDAPRPRGVVITGAAGVGRTRLAREAVDLARAHGRTVHWVRASTSAAGIPLGALAHLIPRAPTGTDELALLQHAAAALSGRTPAGPAVLTVDDAHLLDPLTVTLLHQLAAGDVVTLVVTASGTGPDPLAALWKDDLVLRVDLFALSRAGTDDLVSTVLGGHVDSRTVERLWRLSLGNLRVLRELVECGRGMGLLNARDGLWRWSGPMTPNPRLTGIALAQLDAPSSEGRAAMEMLAVAGPLPVIRLVSLAGREAVSELERSGLVLVDDVVGEARIADPVHAAVLAAHLPTAEAGRIRSRVLVGPVGPRHPRDLLLAGRMLLDGETDHVDPAVLLGAAEQARWAADHPLAERLARAALAAGAGGRVHAVLVESLHWQGRAEDAEHAAAGSGPDGEDLAAARALNLLFGLGRVAEAENVLLAAQDTGLRSAAQAVLALRAGDLDGAVQRGRGVLDAPEAVSGHPLAAGVVGVALAATGRTDEALAVVATGRNASVPRTGPMLAEVTLDHAELLALQFGGRIVRFGERAAELHRDSLDSGESARDATAAMHRGGAALAAGYIDVAARWFAESEDGLRRRDPLGLHTFCMARLAKVRALLGDLAAARDLLTDLENAGDVFAPQVLGARAWVAAGEQRLTDAGELVLDAAESAAVRGQRSVQVGLLHDAVRLGRAVQAIGPLRTLAADLDGPLAAAASEHASATIDDSGAGLDAVSGRFEELGAVLLAAEAAAAAASAHHRAGLRRHGAASTARATTLARRCGSPRTPALAGLAPPRLTGRERDVARLAAAGLANQAIASKLVLSIRTVETHLAHAYTKLGIGSRRELGSALDPRSGDGRIASSDDPR